MFSGCGARTGLETDSSVADAAPPGCGTSGVVKLASRKYATSHYVADAIALYGKYVYWIDPGDAVTGGGAVKRVPKCGGLVQTLASGLVMAYDLGVDQSGVYWVDAGDSGHSVMGGVMRVPRSGGAVTTLASLYDPTCIAVDAPDVFFAVPATASVQSVPEQGGAVTTLATALHNPGDITTNASNIVVAASGTAVRIAKAPHPGATFLVPSSKIAWLVAVDTQHAYWVSGTGSGFGRILKAPLDASQPGVELASGAPTGLAVDGTHVYWTDNGGGKAGAGKLMRVAKPGGTPETLVSGESSAIAGVALDGTYVYWLDDGNVMRREK